MVYVILAYIVIAFVVGCAEAVAFILGFLSRESFIILPPVLTLVWSARQLLSVGLAIGLAGYLLGNPGMARLAGGLAGLIAVMQLSSAIVEWNQGLPTIPLSAIPYAVLATALEGEAAVLRRAGHFGRGR